MTEYYFRNTKTGKRFKVIKLDKTTGEIILKGEYSEFKEQFSKERFQKLGYVLEKESTDAVEPELCP